MNISQEILTHEPSGSANGASTMHELFALSDEQILEIEPEAQDVEVSVAEPRLEGAAGNKLGASAGDASERGATAETPPITDSPTPASGASAPPAWLAEQMSDPRNGSAARELWDGTQRAQQEAAAFHEIFAQPGDARAAAERSRVLDELDRAYFGGTGPGAADAGASRAQLAQTLLREDPVAFREMVFAGLRALEGNRVGRNSDDGTRHNLSVSDGGTRSTVDAAGQAVAQNLTVNAAPGRPGEHAHETSPQQEALVAQYAAFERSANEELERSVGSVIDRTLAEALPNSNRSENSSLHGRLAASIRQDIEKELQGDRRLGEQVAAILAAPRAAAKGRVARADRLDAARHGKRESRFEHRRRSPISQGRLSESQRRAVTGFLAGRPAVSDLRCMPIRRTTSLVIRGPFSSSREPGRKQAQSAV